MTQKITKFIEGIRSDESGATAIEYGLIAALVAVVLIAALTIVGGDLSNMFNNISNSL